MKNTRKPIEYDEPVIGLMTDAEILRKFGPVEGWKVIRLSDLARATMGGRPQ